MPGNIKIKVCQYIPHGAIPDKRGFAPAIVAQNYRKNIDPEKVDLYYISNKEEYEKEIEETEFGMVYRIKEGRLYRKLFRKITRLDPYPLHVRAANIVNQHPVEIFHAHQIEFQVDQFKAKLRHQKTKVIAHSHVTVNAFDPKRGVADQYIAVSNHVREKMVEKGYPEKLITVITNGVDTSLFKPLENNQTLKRKYKIDENDIVVSFVGRKQEGKRFDLFLQLAMYLLQNYSHVTVLAVGPEPIVAQREKSYSKREKIRSSLRKMRKYREIPALAHDKLAEIYQVTDISVLLSTGEAQGMAMVESIASGCLTVSSAVGGILDTIEDGYNGFLLHDPADIETLISKVESILKNIDSDTMKTIKANARHVAVNKFDNKVVTDQLVSLYERLIRE